MSAKETAQGKGCAEKKTVDAIIQGNPVCPGFCWQHSIVSPKVSKSQEAKIKDNGSAFDVQKEIEMVKIFSWQPRKDLAGSVVEKASDTLKDSDNFEDLESDSESLEWESCGEDGSVSTSNTAFPKMKIPQYEKEDWDKEMADNENINNPYDFDDVIQSEDFLDSNPVPPCSVQGQPFYDPSLHHVAPLTLKQVKTVLVDGQFDDAVD